MVAPFNQAWMLLKNVTGGPTGRRMPMTEKESYGDVSFREHPLHGLEDDDEGMGGPSMPPMSRTLGGTPPANFGRAGSTGEIPRGRQVNVEQRGIFGMDAIDDMSLDLEFDDMSPAQRQQLIERINQNIKPSNPFPKPAGQNLRGDLTDWAAGAGREASTPGIVDRTYDKGGTIFDLNEMYDNDEESEYENEPLHENNPAAHNIASTNLRGSPRQNKRGQMDEPRVTPRMQGRAARSISPFIGGD